eukprot:3360944-Rhodomonas_salina.1
MQSAVYPVQSVPEIQRIALDFAVQFSLQLDGLVVQSPASVLVQRSEEGKIERREQRRAMVVCVG